MAGYDQRTGRTHTEILTVSFSATPTYDASINRNFKITLTANVTSSTFVNATTGLVYTWLVCQDGVGTRTHVWPTNVKGAVVITGTANTCAVQACVYDGSNCLALAIGLVGL